MDEYQIVYGDNDTGLSDADYYGRHPALGVDLDACKRAAMAEVTAGFSAIIHGEGRTGSRRIRLAVIRLSMALGNQSYAETYLGRCDYDLGAITSGKFRRNLADKAHLDAAARRKYAMKEMEEELERLLTD